MCGTDKHKKGKIFVMLNTFFSVLEATATPVEANQTAAWGSLIFWCVAMVAVFYFVGVRPQKKKEKEQKEMRDSLQIGDEVATIGGIVGIVVRKDKTEDTVVIETGGDRSKIRVKMWAISQNLTQHDAEEEIAKKK